MIGVIGAGAFGSALASAEARAGREVRLWGRGIVGESMAGGVRRVESLGALRACSVLLLALPAQATAGFLAERGADLPQAPLVLCAKGLEAGSFRLQTEIAASLLPGADLAVLTGPGFASEIGAGLPTALALACADPQAGRALQEVLATPLMRLYHTEDLVGAQLGGALKNVIAIGCGIVEGAGLGHSARAALMTRGFAEMQRLAIARGARAETLSGLSGLGDLALTCNSPQSRNFALGAAIGSGRTRPGGTLEGVATARAACQLGARAGIELPIAAVVADVLDGTTTPAQATEALLARPLKGE